MNHWALDTIRASILYDLNEFVPVNYFEGVTSGMSKGQADSELGMKLRNDLTLKMTGRQRKASDVLLHIGMWESVESNLYTCQTGIEKLSLANLQLEGERNKQEENIKDENCNPLDTLEIIASIHFTLEANLKAVQELDIAATQLKSQLEIGSTDLRTTLQEYVQHLPEDEARPILFYLDNNTKQTVEAKEQTAAKNRGTNQKKWDYEELDALWQESIQPGVTHEFLAKKHGVKRQRISFLLKQYQVKRSKTQNIFNSELFKRVTRKGK